MRVCVLKSVMGPDLQRVVDRFECLFLRVARAAAAESEFSGASQRIRWSVSGLTGLSAH